MNLFFFFFFLVPHKEYTRWVGGWGVLYVFPFFSQVAVSMMISVFSGTRSENRHKYMRGGGEKLFFLDRLLKTRKCFQIPG